MKRSDLVFIGILPPLDWLMLVLAGLVAYYLRFTALTELRPVIYEMPFKSYFLTTLLMAIGGVAIFALAGLYSPKTQHRLSKDFPKIFLACSAGIMLIVLVIFFSRELFSSRFIVLAVWLLAILFVSFGRQVLYSIRRLFFKRGRGLEDVLVVGQDETTAKFLDHLNKNPHLGYRVIGHFTSPDQLSIDQIRRIKEPHLIGEVIQADLSFDQTQTLRLLDFCDQYNFSFRYIANFFDAQVNNVKIETFAQLPLVEIKRTALDEWGRIIKRAIDLIGAVFGLIILSPFFLLIAWLIKRDSPGPTLVKLKRMGEKGKPFELYKFRSMVANAQDLKKDLLAYNERVDGPLFKMANDPRITKIGRILRKTSIDELPQLINVLKGEMSLIGPRPHEPEEVEKYRKRDRRLMTIKPGITGMAQISGRSDIPFEEEARLDIAYIENWSLKLDLRILFKTFSVVLARKHAA